jgi:tetratricopeptide (TPR) repeat protein
MKIALNTPARKRTAAAIVIVIAVAYSLAITREILAVWLGSRPQLTSLRAAAWLDGGSADYRNHLGRYYDLVVRDPGTALVHYKEAVQLNPHSARYWFDLASAYQVLGDRVKQTAALEQAIQADAMTPDVAWEAANLYLVQGENEKALREFRVVMANDPSLAPLSIQFCWRIDPDVDSLLRDVVPHTADAYLPFLGLLQKNADVLLGKVLKPSDGDDIALLTQQMKQATAGTFKVWDALMQTDQPFEIRNVYDYIHFLILQKEVDEAALVWQQAAPRFQRTSYLPSSRNLIVNSRFDLDILNGGFDWQYQKQAGVTLTLDPVEHHAGRRSLLVSFDGAGIHDAGMYQLVVVRPNTTYDFTGFYKNGDFDGAGGPHFTIQDMYTQAVYYESDELKDSESWKTANGEFTTGPDCKLVVLHIRRLPEGSPIRGKLWVDDFHLVQKPS